MEEHTVALEETRNPDYYALMRESNTLMERCSQLNDEIVRCKIALLRVWRARKSLRQLAEGVQEVQKQHSNWNKRMTDFGAAPRFHLSGASDSALSYLHFSGLVWHRMDQVRSQLRILEQNFVLKTNRLDEQRNFVIAITSVVISLLGLLASLCTAWGS
jgi:hypothetical protein